MSLDRQYSFWGSLSPLGGLTGAGLLIMASARLSWAAVITGSLLWVYGFSSFTFSLLVSVIGDKFFPENGRKAVYVCIASFWGSLYIFLFWLLSPMTAMEVFFLLLLVPLYCASNRIEQLETRDIAENTASSLSQALVLICLLLLFSIIREPLSYCMLTFPGAHYGMVTIMYFNRNSFFPIEIFASSSGALLLLGYIACLYQNSKNYIKYGDD